MKNPSACSETVPDSTDRQGALFDIGEFRPDQIPLPEVLLPGTPRLRQANRRQIEFRACAWNDLLPDDHQARVV